jgi:hypothetical protein
MGVGAVAAVAFGVGAVAGTGRCVAESECDLSFFFLRLEIIEGVLMSLRSI